MSKLADNIKLLRARQKISQQKIADALLITRVRYAKYEDGTSEPPIEILLRLSKYFGISIDLLVSVDIRKYPLEEMLNLPDNRILVPITVDASGNNQIEIIPQKASMGYLNGYADPEYIESLQTISLPFLRNGKYRAFPAQGDSMPPYKDGTYIVGKYVEDLSELKTDKTYIFITTNDGITYKRFQFHEATAICVKSDNNFYEPYKIPLSEIKEIWEFACSISTQEYEPEEFSQHNIQNLFVEIKEDIKKINSRMT
ncbi:LexA family transcriptional regulator [Epilithonimonas ginsengisoli]|uniref:LexA family transcriptional regulator n=1 Tax=Epilithonimonas ginsengisoli TaxID=1245592 RepID=A0ABU4JH09_9FLAO|nr:MULTISPECIES: LexA family transcriptional regulator [Chryseobacterium group]MBO6199993.1 LexA family transcriptional regulator [Chryseobacterium sp.]MBV6878757.1 LexA family transcriptional regulator [Epilithonimonas sp. FP105]MDW8548912.1 LexA family transcriptional regulator [Epilithonimonas ginsengisoli]OAH75600.1 XRE family transcriptional regulator [Chryseobacterium sp. FP211-J200]